VLQVTYLGTVGGDTTEVTTRKILSRLFSHELSLQINYTGKHGKLAFGKFKLRGVVLEAVRMNIFCKSATDSAIEGIIMDWFRFAKDRKGGRKNRYLIHEQQGAADK
jgi:hypothetical protein